MTVIMMITAAASGASKLSFAFTVILGIYTVFVRLHIFGSRAELSLPDDDQIEKVLLSLLDPGSRSVRGLSISY